MDIQRLLPRVCRCARESQRPSRFGRAISPIVLAIVLMFLSGCGRGGGGGGDGLLARRGVGGEGPVAPASGPGPVGRDQRELDGTSPTPPADDGEDTTFGAQEGEHLPLLESPLILSLAPLGATDFSWVDDLLLSDVSILQSPSQAATPEPLTGGLAGIGLAALTLYLGRRCR